ncbi:agmatinase [archaeon]|nr:agmatinase [archaeon]|tara:strand:- start:24347 stop:25192 length:846 start_codon:yes stop_codon:yes gene_type:complete
MSNNFLSLPEKYSNEEKSKVVIVPVPYDKTSTWQKGSSKAPKAIIEASKNLELYDIETDSEVYEQGIHTAPSIKVDEDSPESMVQEVESTITKCIKKNKFTIAIGGEHSVSIGSIYAHSKNYKDLTILQLDAHADLKYSYNNSKYNHACVMARAKENCPIVQVGIRSLDISEKESIDENKIFYAKDIHNNTDWIDNVIKQLTKNVYITIDLDVFDPSLISTGTPEPGGLTWYPILELLKKVSQEKNIVGFDIVELLPGKNKSPDFLAAKLIYKILSYKFKI